MPAPQNAAAPTSYTLQYTEPTVSLVRVRYVTSVLVLWVHYVTGLESNMVLVFKNGQQITYHGYRSAQVLISFIEKVRESICEDIDAELLT